MLYEFSLRIFTLKLVFFLVANVVIAQESNVEKFEYLAPQPSSSNVSPYTNIIIREDSILKEYAILQEDILEVTGSKSGVHKGETLLLENSKTILFKPFNKFNDYETVTIQLNCRNPNNQSKTIPQLIFNFTTGKDNSQLPLPELCDLPDDENLKPDPDIDISSPLVYPQLSIITNNNPSDDYLFLGLSSGSTGHLLIVDNDLMPVFYRRVNGTIFDFKYQQNNELTYNIYPVYSYGVDNSGYPNRGFHTPTGYSLDVHDLQVMEDNSYYVLGREFLSIDMSQYVLNGDTAAVVHSHTIHHMDADNNEIWQWRAIDHYDILDVDQYVDLTLHSIDWTHCNALEVDYDGNLLLSTRNFNEISKIDRRTGNIIWRFGGERNQFQMHRDFRGFSRQHDVRRLSNGNLAFFNNGDHLIPRFSSYVEYELNEENYNAVLVRQYSRNQTVYTSSRGGIQELDNGHTLISWGQHQTPSITEFNDYNLTEFEIKFTTYSHQYRAYRFKWETNLFSIKSDTVDFGFVNLGDSSLQSVELYNRNRNAVIINEVLLLSSNFVVNDSLPLIIPPEGKINLAVTFKPDTIGSFSDRLNVRYINDSLMVGQQVMLIGTANIVSVNGDIHSPTSYTLSQNYPNPFNPKTVINFSIPHNEFVIINIYNSLGEKVHSLVNREFEAGAHSINFVNENISSGIYFYKMFAGSFSDTKKLVLLK